VATRADAPDFGRTVQVGWQLLQMGRAGITSLEERSSRLLPAMTAGLIALWTQLHNFDRLGAQIFAWTAWVLLGISIGVLGRLLALRRLSKFWEALILGDPLSGRKPITIEEEAAHIERLGAAMRRHTRTLRRGLQASVGLGALALTLVAIGYVIEQA
jgi:hypothetical protein